MRTIAETRRAGASALPARSARPAARRVTRCRPHSRQPSQSPIRCGHDPAGLRSALCRDSVRNGYALSRCVAPRCRKPTHEPPICARSVPKAALAWPLPTRQTRQKGRLNFLYPSRSCAVVRSLSAPWSWGTGDASRAVPARAPLEGSPPSLAVVAFGEGSARVSARRSQRPSVGS